MLKFNLPEWGAPVVATVVTVAFCVLTFYSAWHGIAADNQVLSQLVGALTIAFGNVVGYYLGSSVGSKNKDGVIAQLTQKGTTP